MIHFCGDGYSSVFPLTASKCCYPPYRLSNLDDLIHTLDLIVGFQLMQYEKLWRRYHTVKPDLNGKEVMKQWSSEYKVLCAPAITSKDHFKNLGFLGGCDTLMYVSDRKAKFPGTSLYALGRSWFKEGVTEKAKGYLKEVVEQAKAAMVLARMSRKKGRWFKNRFFLPLPFVEKRSLYQRFEV